MAARCRTTPGSAPSLQDPQNGDILAIYGGPGMNLPKAQCAEFDCQVNNAVYAREQVGSSFKPYVLSEAVIQGMNVKTSTLNGFSPLWVPQDTPESDAMALSTTSEAKALPESFEVNNDCLCSLGAMTVQNAFAQSSNTAFTDLAHRVGTENIINLAGEMGVNTAALPGWLRPARSCSRARSAWRSAPPPSRSTSRTRCSRRSTTAAPITRRT